MYYCHVFFKLCLVFLLQLAVEAELRFGGTTNDMEKKLPDTLRNISKVVTLSEDTFTGIDKFLSAFFTFSD